MKTIIVGNRNIISTEKVEQAIKRSGMPVTEVITGDADGVQHLAKQYGYNHGLSVTECRADWERDGKGAGVKAAQRMAEMGEQLIAITDGRDPAVAYAIGFAKAKGLPVFVSLQQASFKRF